MRFQFSLRFVLAAVLCGTICVAPYLRGGVPYWLGFSSWLHAASAIALFVGLTRCKQAHQAVYWALAAEYLSLIDLVWGLYRCFDVMGHSTAQSLRSDIQYELFNYGPTSLVALATVILLLMRSGNELRRKWIYWLLAIIPTLNAAVLFYCNLKLLTLEEWRFPG